MADRLEIEENLKRLANEAGRGDLASRLEGEHGQEEFKGTGWIAILGEFGRGKTTLLNALIGRAALPAGGYPMETERLVVVSDESGEGAQERGQQEIRVRAPLGEIHAQLVEAPGLGDINPAHREVAEAVLRGAKGVIFVLDGKAPLGQAEKAWIEKVREHCEVVVVINKADQFAEGEAVREFVQGELGEGVEVLVVSARAQLEQGAGGADWQRLRKALLRLGEAEAQAWKPEVVSQQQLLAVAGELAKALEMRVARFLPEVEAELRKPRGGSERAGLLRQMVADQCADIQKTVEDSYEARIFELERGMRNRKIGMQEALAGLEQWKQGAEERAQRRMVRLYAHVIDELNRNGDTHAAEAEPKAVVVERSFTRAALAGSGRIPREDRALGAVGGGILSAALTYSLPFIPTALRLVASISTGSLVGLVIWGVSGQFSAGRTGPEVSLTETGQDVLAGFRENILNNQARLVGLVNDHTAAGSEETAPKPGLAGAGAEQKHFEEMLAQVYAIQTSLRNGKSNNTHP